MENEKSQLGYREDEVVTPAEKAFMEEMIERKNDLEAFILNLIDSRRNGGSIFRSLAVERSHFQRAYDFVHEIDALVNNHVCKYPSPSCWAEKLVKIRDEFVRFLAPHEVIFMACGGIAEAIDTENFVS